jgi:hypothetical protein
MKAESRIVSPARMRQLNRNSVHNSGSVCGRRVLKTERSARERESAGEGKEKEALGPGTVGLRPRARHGSRSGRRAELFQRDVTLKKRFGLRIEHRSVTKSARTAPQY